MRVLWADQPAVDRAFRRETGQLDPVAATCACSPAIDALTAGASILEVAGLSTTSQAQPGAVSLRTLGVSPGLYFDGRRRAAGMTGRLPVATTASAGPGREPATREGKIEGVGWVSGEPAGAPQWSSRASTLLPLATVSTSHPIYRQGTAGRRRSTGMLADRSGGNARQDQCVSGAVPIAPPGLRRHRDQHEAEPYRPSRPLPKYRGATAVSGWPVPRDIGGMITLRPARRRSGARPNQHGAMIAKPPACGVQPAHRAQQQRQEQFTRRHRKGSSCARQSAGVGSLQLGRAPKELPQAEGRRAGLPSLELDTPKLSCRRYRLMTTARPQWRCTKGSRGETRRGRRRCG